MANIQHQYVFRKQYRLYFLAVSTSLAIALHHAAQSPSASAGGSDDLRMTETEEPMLESISEKGGLPLNFDWKRWSQPYTQCEQTCREYQGNVICLTPQIAYKMSWSSKISQASLAQSE